MGIVWEKPGRSAQPVAVSSSTGERVEGRVFESPAATKRTARDRETDRKSRSAPLATANGYRPADGWGVVNQAWRPGKTGIIKQGQHHAET